MEHRGKLELTWVGKYEEKAIEPRILVEDPEKSYGDPHSENMLIHGDNLIALQALQQDFAGKIKCIYIDPPYNTGTAFEYYDDGMEHSTWLTMIRPRLELLWNLLDETYGSIWISIDDAEQAYMRVLCDELFGRGNFIAQIVWQKRYSRENREAIGDVHEYIIVYAKNPIAFKENRNLVPMSEEQAKVYKNPNNDPKGRWRTIPITAQAGHATPSQFYTIVTPSGKKFDPPPGNCWRFTEERYKELVREGRIYFGKDGKSQPTTIRYLSEVPGVAPWTWWPSDEVGHTDSAKKEILALFGKDNIFDTPKPETLIQRIVHIASNPGDYVLDSFLGSGTTAAVAHKMGRKYIGIEMGNHAYSHCKMRLDKVVDGTDEGGITKAAEWHGGGGYHFYELAPSLLVRNPRLPIYQINPEYTFEMMCEAICKIEGFRYKPEGLFHGFSSEKRFIHVTKEFVNAEYVRSVASSLGEGQSLLIYGMAIQSDMILPDNIEVRKIPKDLLKKCSFESEVR